MHCVLLIENLRGLHRVNSLLPRGSSTLFLLRQYLSTQQGLKDQCPPDHNRRTSLCPDRYVFQVPLSPFPPTNQFSLVTNVEIVSLHGPIKSHMVPSWPRKRRPPHTAPRFNPRELEGASLQTSLPCWLCNSSLLCAILLFSQTQSFLSVLQASVVPSCSGCPTSQCLCLSLSFDIGSW